MRPIQQVIVEYFTVSPSPLSDREIVIAAVGWIVVIVSLMLFATSERS